MPFLPPNQQHQSTEGQFFDNNAEKINFKQISAAPYVYNLINTKQMHQHNLCKTFMFHDNLTHGICHSQ